MSVCYLYQNKILGANFVLYEKTDFLGKIQKKFAFSYSNSQPFYPMLTGFVRLLMLFISSALTLEITAQSSLSQINQTDQQGRKQGKWEKRLDDGTLVYRGFFRNDIPEGEFTYYYNNGTVKAILRYEPDGLTSQSFFFFPNGRVQGQGTHHNRQKTGIWVFFNEQGQKVSEEYYKNDLKDGLCKEFYSTGELLEECEYRNGLKHGEWRQYFPDGSLKTRGSFTDGNLHGPVNFYYADGMIYLIGYYLNGLKSGEWKFYTPDGKLKRTETWNNDELQSSYDEP